MQTLIKRKLIFNIKFYTESAKCKQEDNGEQSFNLDNKWFHVWNMVTVKMTGEKNLEQKEKTGRNAIWDGKEAGDNSRWVKVEWL